MNHLTSAAQAARDLLYVVNPAAQRLNEFRRRLSFIQITRLRAMRKLIAAVFALIGLFPLTVFAGDDSLRPKSSFSTDMSDLWWIPSESGWGMQLVQQVNLIFATLFIYGANGQPTWAVAPIEPAGFLQWSGPLYVTTGPWFGGVFNPTAVGTRQAGTLTFSSSASIAFGSLTYTIDGVTVTKQVQRQLLRYDNYNGGFLIAANITQSSCFSPSSNGFFNGALAISITQSGTSMAMAWGFANGSTCNYSGSYNQFGRLGQFSGSYACSTGEVGNMTFFEMTNRVGMISGRLSGHSTNIGCQYTGRFTGLDPNKS